MKTTSGGMNPMLSMTLIVIRASTSAAIGMSHCAVLLAPGAMTAAAVAPVALRRRHRKRSIDRHVDSSSSGCWSKRRPGLRRTPSGGLPSRLLRGYCPLMDGNVGAAPELIGALSVLGEQFDVQLAVEISGLAPADLLRAMDIAQREGLVVVEGGLVRFTPGQREAAYNAPRFAWPGDGACVRGGDAGAGATRRPVGHRRATSRRSGGPGPRAGARGPRRCRQRRRAGPRLGGRGTALEACGRGRCSGARPPRRPVGDPARTMPLPRRVLLRGGDGLPSGRE